MDKFTDLKEKKDKKTEVVENFYRFNNLKHATINPKAFTEDAATIKKM